MGGWLDWRVRVVAGALLAITVVGVALWLARVFDERPTVVILPAPTPTAVSLQVYVSGAVAQPGVYEFHDGDRVVDALAAAGGPSAEADLDSINLAIRLRDEQQVFVPARTIGGQAGPGAPDKLNLNTATQPQLEALPGIGTVTALKILDYRQRNGAFKGVDELTQAKLVTASTYEKIKDLVTVR